MASNTRRAIMADIVEHGLDPNKAHHVIARNGRLAPKHPTKYVEPEVEQKTEPKPPRLALKQLKVEPIKVEPEPEVFELKDETSLLEDVELQAALEPAQIVPEHVEVKPGEEAESTKKAEKRVEKVVEKAQKKATKPSKKVNPTDAS